MRHCLAFRRQNSRAPPAQLCSLVRIAHQIEDWRSRHLQEWKNARWKKPSVAYVRSERQYCVLSEDRYRHCDLHLWPFDSKINGFPGLIVEHLYVTFDDRSCIVSWDIVRKKTDSQTAVRTYTLTTAVGVAISYRTCVALCAVNFRMSAVADRVGEVVQQHLRRVLRHLPFLGESHESGSAVVAWNARTAWSMPSQGRLPRRKFSAVSLLIRRSVKCENAKPRRHESTKRSNKYRTSVFGDGRISTHADPTLGQRSGQSYIARSTPSWPGCGSRASANALGEQSSPKCEIPCPGRR